MREKMDVRTAIRIAQIDVITRERVAEEIAARRNRSKRGAKSRKGTQRECGSAKGADKDRAGVFDSWRRVTEECYVQAA